tara:strand:+ start:3845 stop:4957 length:1113 start_codon:yes stop_codon:yes gene_type:complete
MNKLTLLFSGKRGGGITDLTNIINGFIDNENTQTRLSIITLRRFSHLEELCNKNNISYSYITAECNNILKEFYVNIIFILTITKNIFFAKNIIFTMTHPNLLFLPLYRLISFFTSCRLYYIRHNPTGFRHVANSLKNILIVLTDYIASMFSHRLLFFSRNVLHSFEQSLYKNKLYYIGFGINSFNKLPTEPYSPSTQTFIFFGRCLPYKGLDILIEALKLIDDRSLNFIIASNSIPKDYINKLSELKHRHNIDIFNEWLDDDRLDILFKKSSCAILPYRAISQSGPILTSVGYNIPIIASDLSGIKEYLTDLEDSLLFISEDPGSLKEKILLFHDSASIQNKLRKGIISTSKKFSWKNVSINIENLTTDD